MNRRQFLTFGSVGALLTAGGAGASDITSDKLEDVPLVIERSSVPPAFDGFRIAFLTDLHLSPCLSYDLVRSALIRARAFTPDLLLLGGDFIWHSQGISTQIAISGAARTACFKDNSESAREVYSLLGEMLRETRVAEQTFFVLGNHDRWSTAIENVRLMESSSARLLVNDDFTLERSNSYLRIIGVDDYWTGIPKIPSGVSANPRLREFRILVAHNPDYVSWLLDDSDFHFDLALSGHTHGGQVKLPWLGAPFYNVRDRRLAEGLFKHGQALAYTSRGVGMAWFPIRINCRPEVTLITLRHADDTQKM